MTEAEVTALAAKIARRVFQCGDERTPCQRIEFMGGIYPDNEIRQGGLCEVALYRVIDDCLREHFNLHQNKQ